MKTIIASFNILAALTAFIASLYWFKASRSNLPKIYQTTGKPSSPISMLAMSDEIIKASRLNRIAAVWSGLAALFGAVSF